MKKINFVNGTTIDGASTFNQMQNNVEEVFNGEEAMGSIVVDDVECKNLLNADVLDSASNATWTGSGSTHYYTSDTTWKGVYWFVSVKAGEKYTFSYKNRNSSALYVFISEYDDDKNYIQHIIKDGTDTKYSFEIENDGLLRIGFMNNAVVSNVAIEDIQLEKGDKATLYTPYKEFSNKQIYSTNEQVVGEWLGKPLYQKTYETTSSTVYIDALPYDLLFVHEAIIELSTGATFTMGRYMNSTDFFTTYAYKNNNIVSIDLGSTWAMSKGFITVRYTKNN